METWLLVFIREKSGKYDMTVVEMNIEQLNLSRQQVNMEVMSLH